MIIKCRRTGRDSALLEHHQCAVAAAKRLISSNCNDRGSEPQTLSASCRPVPRFDTIKRYGSSYRPPMLCERLTSPARLSDRAYIAEPKLDGQPAQLHVRGSRAVACYSRRGLDLLERPGMAWLREIPGPFKSAIFDGEACAGDGHEGIQAVFTERNRVGGDMALVLFDLPHVGGKRVMREPWRHRRKRLDDLLQGHQLPRIAVVPVTDDAPTLYETWVGMGGEGIVLKDPASLYRQGEGSPAWLKVKPRLELDVTVTGGSP